MHKIFNNKTNFIQNFLLFKDNGTLYVKTLSTIGRELKIITGIPISVADFTNKLCNFISKTIIKLGRFVKFKTPEYIFKFLINFFFLEKT